MSERVPLGVAAAAIPATPTIQEEQLITADGLTLHLRVCAVDRPRAAVILIHGHSEYSARYEHVMRTLAMWGYSTIAPDHRGHGKSARLRGYIHSVDEIVRDIGLVRRHARRCFGDIPTLVWGHSMGGLLTLRYLQTAQYDLAGAILASAAARIPPRLSRRLVRVAEHLARWVPTLGIQSVSEPGWSCNDPEFRVAADLDPLVYHGRMRAQTGWALLQAMRAANAELSKIELPVLVMHGSHDRIVSSEASLAIYSGVSSSDRSLRVFPGCVHELHNDLQRARVFEVVREWLDARCPEQLQADEKVAARAGDRLGVALAGEAERVGIDGAQA